MQRLSRNSRKPKSGRLKTLIKLTLACGVLAAAALSILLVYLYQSPLPPIDSDQNSIMFDASGEAAAVFSPAEKNQENIKLDQIAPSLIKATLAVEDRHFYEHVGFDFKGMARAVLVNVEHLDTLQGASTLTQQLARNLYLTHERTWTRKAKEALYTAQLEMKYSKQDILQMYLNQIYYGHGAYGIEAAAKTYFGKSAKDLTLAESAMLAGIPKGPTYYSPFNHMKNAKDRQKTVLGTMVDNGDITRGQADQAYAQILHFQSPSMRTTDDKAPYFRDYVRSVLMDDLGISEELLDHGGLRVYTTLDTEAQAAAEEAVRSGVGNDAELEAALVSIDPRSGYVKALVGGTNYIKSQYNHVFATTRQPGSSFKPIMYLTALSSKKMTVASQFNSEPTLFHYDDNRKTYSPKNFGEKYLGEINMKRAIAASDNIYAVNTLMTVGADNVIDMARRMGITSKLQAVPSLALGTSPVSPFEMASAFAVISNQGRSVKPVTVLKVTDAFGTVLYEAPKAQPLQVVEPAAAYVLTHMMEGVFDTGGTGSRVSALMKRPVAGKTGTTSTDAWLVGFTPELSTAVWVGYDKGKTLGTTASRKAAPIFATFTEKALEKVPPKMFPVPDGVVSAYIDMATGKLADAGCGEKELEVFIAGTEPKETCTGTTPPAKSESLPEPAKEQSHSWWQDLKRWWME
ncbi:transglycosylase domain-containing protein [Paenibacillus physcomitrellae]|uniref:Penicillin-binding protein 2D n=1 Tax=Paenibacillus physcomitrellae TaxID=1619311 RepID=A0ABQ1GYF4_9BACL|nr:PBP1A family penicillin-binding protein [Paenibacillus physcomitrellae]GGA52979.1 penicillin-binding protein 2D [Paenibacillus physcomitrellae]